MFLLQWSNRAHELNAMPGPLVSPSLPPTEATPGLRGLKYTPFLLSRGLVTGIGNCPKMSTVFANSVFLLPHLYPKESLELYWRNSSSTLAEKSPRLQLILLCCLQNGRMSCSDVCSVETWLIFWSHCLIFLISFSLKLLNIYSGLWIRWLGFKPWYCHFLCPSVESGCLNFLLLDLNSQVLIDIIWVEATITATGTEWKLKKYFWKNNLKNAYFFSRPYTVASTQQNVQNNWYCFILGNMCQQVQVTNIPDESSKDIGQKAWKPFATK